MAGTPGSGWPPYPSPSTEGGESQRAQLEAALRVVREQRPQLAAEIGEYLYSLVLQGQLQDPVVLATCRRLYDHEQQVSQLEANLRAIPVAPPPISQQPVYRPPSVVNRPPGVVADSYAIGSEESATVIAPAGRASHDGTPFATPDAEGTRIVPGTSSSNEPFGQRAQSADGATVVQRATPGPRDAPPSPRRPADLDAAQTVIAPVRRPEPATPGVGKPAERRCSHCRMPLRANDTSCPVCGRAVSEHAAESPQCRRCGTELRPQDRSCPVCGTPRT